MHIIRKTKPLKLRNLIENVQDKLKEKLPDIFKAYKMDQVHGTIIGLEGFRVGKEIISQNFADLRGQIRVINFNGIAKIIEDISANNNSVAVQLGGSNPKKEYFFGSRGEVPYVRSFSLQGRIAVAMGFPKSNNNFSPALDNLRRSMSEAGTLHKYHASPSEVDNDFFFVLGQINRRKLSNQKLRNDVQTAVNEVRTMLAEEDPIQLPINSSCISIAAYEKTTLDPKKTVVFDVQAIATNPMDLVYCPKLLIDIL